MRVFLNRIYTRTYTPFLSADSGAASGGAAAATSESKEQTPPTPEEVDRRIEEAKKTARAEAQADYEREQREAKLAEREADIAKRELRAETTKTLAEKGLPADVLDLVIGSDAKQTVERIDIFKSTFDQAVQAGVEARLQGKTPMAGSSVATKTADEHIRSAFSSALKGGFR